MLNFYYNGIKANGGKLQKCFYSNSQLINAPVGTLTIYARDYSRFSAEVRAAFKVENNTDIMTDYFESDSIRVEPSHSLYAQVKTACDLQSAKRAAKTAQRNAIWEAKRAA